MAVKTPFSDSVWEKVIQMAEKGRDPQDIRVFVEEDLKKFGANVLKDQNEKLADEVITRMEAGESFDKISAEKHMPPPENIRKAILSSSSAKNRLIAMQALQNKKIISNFYEALDKMGELALKGGKADEIKKLKIFTDAAAKAIEKNLLEQKDDKRVDLESFASSSLSVREKLRAQSQLPN